MRGASHALLLASLAIPRPTMSAAHALQERLRAGSPVVVDLGGSKGAAPAVELAYEASASGVLAVWARSAELDARLRIDSSIGGRAAQDDDSGGGTTAYLLVPVAAGETIAITVLAEDAQASGAVEVTAAETPETERTTSAAAAAASTLAEAEAMRNARDLAGARSALARAFDELESAGATSHATARVAQGIGRAARACGDLATARKAWTGLVEFLGRTEPPEHPARIDAQRQLAITLHYLGDDRTSGDLLRAVLAARERSLPPDHPDVVMARADVGSNLFALGDLRGARVLMEQVLEARARSLPEDSPEVQHARGNLAGVLLESGDLQRARRLNESVLDVFLRTLPDDDPDLQRARQNLGDVLFALDDAGGARELFEKVLEVRSAALPDEHRDVNVARTNLAAVLQYQGDVQGALALARHSLETLSASFPADHPVLESLRQNIAGLLVEAGDPDAAYAMMEQVVESRERTLPEDHPDVLDARKNLASVMRRRGDAGAARDLLEGMRAARARIYPEGHPRRIDVDLECVRTLALLDDREALVGLVRELCDDVRQEILGAGATRSPREAEALAIEREVHVSMVLSLVLGAGRSGALPELTGEAWALVESMRAVGLVSAELFRGAREDPVVTELRGAVRTSSEELVRLARGSGDRDQLAAARRTLEQAQRDLLQRLSADGLPPGAYSAADAERVSGSLAEDEALVGFRRYTRYAFDPEDPSRARAMAEVCAFVLRRGARLALVELGPEADLVSAVAAWRVSIGSSPDVRGRVAAGDTPLPALDERAAGEAVRALVLDPLQPSLGGARRVTVLLDGALHLVPLDALPAGPADGLVGQALQIEVRASMRDAVRPPTAAPASGALVVLGGVDYGGADRAGAFSPLPGTAAEARAIVAIWRDRVGENVEELIGAAASRDRLLASAPHARYLHLATHGWFAPDSVASSADAASAGARSGLSDPLSREEQIRGSAPMILCGLALCGANAAPDVLGRVPGRITAEEIAALDLRACELAVLSACDTNVGLLRAGQGVASLQKGLHMAGVRSAITSLWKVPDEATKELMLGFYRRLWIEGKPKSRALWETKMALRDARDAQGRPLYSTRDWAAWVLTGEPE